MPQGIFYQSISGSSRENNPVGSSLQGQCANQSREIICHFANIFFVIPFCPSTVNVAIIRHQILPEEISQDCNNYLVSIHQGHRVA